jgi:putative endonuclease
MSVATDTPYFLYILESGTTARYYVGISSDPHRRLEYHNSVERGFTSRYRPWRLVYSKECSSKAEARQAEKMVKVWKSRKLITQLITGDRSI